MSGGKRKPKTKTQPQGQGRTPRTTARVQGDGRTPRALPPGAAGEEDDKPRFSLRYADSAFRYTEPWTAAEHAAEVLTFMHAFGTTKWEELRRQTTGSGTRRPRYHSHEFDEVRPEAQERLSTLGHDLVFERLVRYRTSGKGRAWGFEVDGVFYLLWWDTEHAVYPVSRK